jgi:hypothetical protein
VDPPRPPAVKSRHWPPLAIATTSDPDPLDYLRDGLVLARRAGMPWHEAYPAAEQAALAAAKDNAQRDEWLDVFYDTRTAWMRAYERRPTGCPL